MILSYFRFPDSLDYDFSKVFSSVYLFCLLYDKSIVILYRKILPDLVLLADVAIIQVIQRSSRQLVTPNLVEFLMSLPFFL